MLPALYYPECPLVNARRVSCVFALSTHNDVLDLLWSARLFETLRALKADPTVGKSIDVRGQGLMVAVEFALPAYSSFDPAVQNKTPLNLSVHKRCLETGLLPLATSVRFIPVLNVSPEDLVKGIRIFKNAVEDAIQDA
jgi:4-aminobutyrate aminotransferase